MRTVACAAQAEAPESLPPSKSQQGITERMSHLLLVLSELGGAGWPAGIGSQKVFLTCQTHLFDLSSW